MWRNTDVKPVKTFWEKTEIFNYFDAQNGPKIGPLRPIFYSPLKVVTMSMGNNTDVKRIKKIEKMTKNRNLVPILGSQNWCDEAPYCTHLWKELQWAYKVRLIWILRELFDKIVEYCILTYLEAQNGLKMWAYAAYKSSSTPTKVNPTSL